MHLPLLVSVPGVEPGVYPGHSSVVDVMPTVMELFGKTPPGWVDGRSLLPAMRDLSTTGREYTISTIPFANPGDRVRSVDNVLRTLSTGLVTTVTAGEWALLYSVDPGKSELYHLPDDPQQGSNVIGENAETARELHGLLVKFMRETNVEDGLVQPRLELRL